MCTVLSRGLYKNNHTKIFVIVQTESKLYVQLYIHLCIMDKYIVASSYNGILYRNELNKVQLTCNNLNKY